MLHIVRSWKKNEWGYNCTKSTNLERKISPIASDWELLLERKPYPKQLALGELFLVINFLAM